MRMKRRRVLHHTLKGGLEVDTGGCFRSTGLGRGRTLRDSVQPGCVSPEGGLQKAVLTRRQRVRWWEARHFIHMAYTSSSQFHKTDPQVL